MSRNSSVYFILWILLQVLLLVKVNCQPTPFKPRVYSCHTATFIDNKLYILGGLDLNSKMLNEFFYLDVSVPFNTQELSWQDLSNINMVPEHFLATSVKGGTNNDTLFLYGAFQSETLVYTFNSRSLVWSTPTISGKVDMLPSVQTDPSSRDVIFEQELINVRRGKKYGLTGVIDYNKKFYLWGGATSNITLINDMLVLDTINLNWDGGSLINKLLISDTNYTVWMSWYGPDHVPNVPTPRRDYSATLIPKYKIIYLGGIGDIVSFEIITKGTTYNLSEVYIYDTINNSWDTKITSGNIPSDRGAFSTILGEGYDKLIESDILLLDISNNEEYISTTMFDPKIPSQPPSPSPSQSPSPSPSLSLSRSPSSPSSPNNSGNIAGAVVGSLLSGILLSVEINNDAQEIIQIPGNENTTNHEPIIISPSVINKNSYYKQEIVLSPENENTTNHESIIIPVDDHHGQEIMRTLQNENTTSNHEPAISPSAVVNTNNDNHGQEVISSQLLKDEIIQAIKQEIGQNLKNEILQAVEENFNITKNINA
ncbi:hypothetical protein RhiirB3_389970 [Rhizophagus irregularis]|nr:hypothetical protein RhiirB3_389970 [Rhizophagus irregularis]